MKLLSTNRIREFFTAATAYLAISVFFLFGLVTSRGDVAQQDWSIPLTAGAALNIFHSTLFAWSYSGFGGVNRVWGFPFFQIINAALAPLGFFGATEIKVLAVALIALAGIATYVLAKSFGLGWRSSFLAGLFFMTTPVVFNWLMFGWIFYLIGYALIPVMILTTKKFLETNDLRYALVDGIILSIATAQISYILVYPLLGFLFVLFESKGNTRILIRGIVVTAISLLVWSLTWLNFFVSFNSESLLSFYQGSFLGATISQFSHLSHLINPIRLWGSSFNYQFETYFPKEVTLLSFIPVIVATIGIILRPRDRRVLFLSSAYLFVFVAYFSNSNMYYLVFNLPYGTIFEAPSIFLVPASLGLALLIGYTNKTISDTILKFGNVKRRHIIRNISFLTILVLIILASIPWYTGQTSGNPLPGSPTKMNLYKIPSGYTEWSKTVAANKEYLVLYLPFPDTQIMNTSYFSLPSEGLNSIIFTGANDLPFVSSSNTTLLLSELFNGTSELAETWGAFSIKYIVVYTNVQSTYNMTDLLNRLSEQSGIEKVATLPSVIVYQNEYAMPIIHTNSLDVALQITYNDPTSYKVLVNSTSPFLLTLSQVYSSGWLASVNGTTLPSADHIKEDNGFNGWLINYTGTMMIDVNYEPQTNYFSSILVSSGVIIVILLYLVIATLRDVKIHKTYNQKTYH